MSVPAVDVTSSAFKANARVAFTPRLVERMRSRVESQSEELLSSQGIHYCLGAPLARLEGQIAQGLNLRGLETLPVAW